jgi:hypothetical protein
MIKPILLTVWPIHLDYPLFRYNLARDKDYFSGIWIALSNHHIGVDYTNFIMQSLSFARFVDVKHTGLDWRNDAVNETLNQIKTDEPICFVEEDFFWTPKFLQKVFSSNESFVYHMEGPRIHPAFALINRELIEKTTRDFSAYPGVHGDHFAKFFNELPTGKCFGELTLHNKKDYFHLNGLSQNYMNYKDNQPFYQPLDFLYYNKKCLKLPVENHPEFLQIEKAIYIKYKAPDRHPFLDRLFP